MLEDYYGKYIYSGMAIELYEGSWLIGVGKFF
jgi:hypothetical protein